jgi:hypothetical protein
MAFPPSVPPGPDAGLLGGLAPHLGGGQQQQYGQPPMQQAGYPMQQMQPQAPAGYPNFAPPAAPVPARNPAIYLNTADAARYPCYEGALKLVKDVLTPLYRAQAINRCADSER